MARYAGPRYKGLAMHEDVERMNARWLQQIKSYNALTLLSRATLGAANQFFTYGLAKPVGRTCSTG